jgi:hypothetical protein
MPETFEEPVGLREGERFETDTVDCQQQLAACWDRRGSTAGARSPEATNENYQDNERGEQRPV